jgi:hypothetical protein
LRFRRRVPRLFPHEDRDGDVIGVLAEDLAQFRTGQQLVFPGPQVENDVRPARLLRTVSTV